MRLIDADALFINLDGMMEVSPTGYIHGDTVADMISDAPTVDAVPVEWIENYLRNYRYMAPIEKNFVREMIKAWAERKEE